jgi:hypothetical protein
MKEVEEFILKKQEEDSKKHKIPPNNYFYASSALSCPRSEFWNRKNPKKVDTPLAKIFFLGNLIHELYQSCIPGEDEVELKIEDNGLIVSGRIDKLTPEGIPLEFKTVGNIKYSELEPSHHHVAQLNLYLHHLKKPMGKLVYIDKRNLKTVEHVVKYDPKLYRETMNHFNKIYWALEENELPEYPFGYSFRTFPCTYCKYRKECMAAEAQLYEQRTLNETRRKDK